MTLFSYETALEYESGDQFLEDVRRTVQRLRKSHPELKDFSLADMAVQKKKAVINVTLFFRPE